MLRSHWKICFSDIYPASPSDADVTFSPRLGGEASGNLDIEVAHSNIIQKDTFKLVSQSQDLSEPTASDMINNF